VSGLRSWVSGKAWGLRRGLGSSGLVWAIFCFVSLSSGWLYPHQLPDSTEGIDENSDWWSILRANTDDAHLKPQDVATNRSNLQIAGITVGEDELSAIVTKLGRVKEVSRGDAATARSQICYGSMDRLIRRDAYTLSLK